MGVNPARTPRAASAPRAPAHRAPAHRAPAQRKNQWRSRPARLFLQRPARPARLSLLTCLLAILVLPACQSSDTPSGIWGADRVRAWPFAPGRVRIHPLSRVQREPEALLILHLEMLDPWGDTTKGVGLVRIAAGPERGSAMQWEIDLRDAELNASLYDASTRTYRLQLRGLAAPRGEGEINVRIEFVGPGPDGRERTLTDETTVRVGD